MFPDDVLLDIFDVYVNGHSDIETFKKSTEEWQILVHVCRRWRSLVFASPRRLNLRLVCTQETPARDTLDVWPSLPLLIRDTADPTKGMDDIIAVLERSNRVVEIQLFKVDGSDLEKVLAAMQVPFPELTDLELRSYTGMETVLPNSFLGGSAPRLEYLQLTHIPFPGLPKLLLSAPHLVDLSLMNIPHSGYFSPEAMVTALSMLTSLKRLFLEFESPDRASRRPPPLRRSVLPVLTWFEFKGVCEYLEDLVANIDVPQLERLEITFFNQIVFDTPQLIQFISRTPSLKAFEKAQVRFRYGASGVNLSSQTPGYGTLNVQILCMDLDWQVSSMEQVCTSCLPHLSTLGDLYIYGHQYSHTARQDNVENTLWLELLQPFTGVKNLHLSEEFASRIMPALQELVGERSTEVLPTLQNVFLQELEPSGTVQAAIWQFVATREVISHPIAVSRWDNPEEYMVRNF